MTSTAAAAGAADVDGTSDTVGLLSASSSTSATADDDGKQQHGPTTADGVPFDPKSLLDR